MTGHVPQWQASASQRARAAAAQAHERQLGRRMTPEERAEFNARYHAAAAEPTRTEHEAAPGPTLVSAGPRGGSGETRPAWRPTAPMQRPRAAPDTDAGVLSPLGAAVAGGLGGYVGARFVGLRAAALIGAAAALGGWLYAGGELALPRGIGG